MSRKVRVIDFTYKDIMTNSADYLKFSTFNSDLSDLENANPTDDLVYLTKYYKIKEMAAPHGKIEYIGICDEDLKILLPIIKEYEIKIEELRLQLNCTTDFIRKYTSELRKLESKWYVKLYYFIIKLLKRG